MLGREGEGPGEAGALAGAALVDGMSLPAPRVAEAMPELIPEAAPDGTTAGAGSGARGAVSSPSRSRLGSGGAALADADIEAASVANRACPTATATPSAAIDAPTIAAITASLRRVAACAGVGGCASLPPLPCPHRDGALAAWAALAGAGATASVLLGSSGSLSVGRSGFTLLNWIVAIRDT
jgi:hypothetical protein